MLTVIGLKEEALTAILDAVKQSHPNSELCIGNHLFPIGFVVSGNTEQVEEVGRRAERSGAMVKQVKVHGAFHSKLMEPAVAQLKAFLKDVDIREPVVPVYSNVTGLPYASVDEIREGLALQITSPVLWSATISHMITKTAYPKPDVKFLEIGPGRQLRGMLKRIDRSAYRMSDSLIV
jgi:[acyl-carrier-protein] S-malonyltransferase